MTSFMGPMAPPPAAPAQPQALDIRTDPNRRQQFKQFMKQRTSMAPMVSAPIAQPPMPMMPPPMPMGGQDIDIFNPVNLHEGGLVPSLNSLQQQAAQFSQKLQSTVMGDSQGGGMGAGMGGGGFGGSFNSGGDMGGSFSSPGFTTNTTSGGLVPGGLKSVSPPPDANVSDFFQNFNNTNSGESYMKMSDHPAFTSEPLRPRPTGGDSYLKLNPNQTPNDPNRYKNSTIDQGFYESDLFKNLDMSGPRTADMQPASESTGGFSGSSTDIGRLKNAYQQYLQGGQQGGMQQAVVNPQVDPNPFISGQQPMSSSVTNSPTTVYRDYGLQNIDNPNFRPVRPAVSPYADQLRNNTRSELSSDSPFFNVPEAGTGQRLPSDSSALGGGVSNLIANNPYLSGIGGIGNFAGNLLMRNKGGAVPPRNTDIRGQDHMLSYITPDEADILQALGGSGEAGPMGIPAYAEDDGDEDGSSGAGHGGGSDSDDVGGGPGGGDGSGNEGGFGGGMGEGQDNTGIADAAGYGSGSSDTSNSDADEISDAIADIAAAEIAGQMADDRAAARAGLEKTVRAGMLMSAKTDKPVNTLDPVTGKVSGQVMSGTKAEQAAAKSAYAQLEALDNLNAVEAVTGVPADPLSSNKTGLLGFDYDLLQANIDKAIDARKGMPTPVSPLATSQFNAQNLAAAPIGLQDIQAIDELSFGPPSSIDPVSAPSSNAPGQLSSAEMSALDALAARGFDQNTAQMGLRADDLTSSQVAENVAANIGYNPVTDMPYGLEFATNPAVPGAQFTTNLAALTEQQKADQPLAMDIGQFVGSKPYGYEIDPKTGQVIGQIGTPPMGILGSLTTLAQNLFMGPPQTTQDLIERGVYSGMTDLGNTGGGDGDDQQAQVKAPTDPCPDGFVMKDGACTPIETGSGFPNQIGGIGGGDVTAPVMPPPVIVPSPRSNFPGYSLQGPVGYGSPIAGQAAPSVASNAAMYQQMLQGMRPPLRLEDGGAVPPRNVEISGQDHMLSYITPDEADILKALGGSGNPGPMGIPAFNGDATFPTFYTVPVGQGGNDQEYKRVYIGSKQDTMENRIAGSSDLASAVQDAGPGYLPQAYNRQSYLKQYERDLAKLRGQPDPYPDPVPDPVVGPVVPDPVAPDPVDPNAYNPIMDVVVPSTRLQDFPASAPPDVSIQPMPMQLQGPVGYGSPIAGQIAPSVVSNAAMYQDMLSQPFPLNFQQGGSVSSNLDMAADNFLKALMPAA